MTSDSSPTTSPAPARRDHGSNATDELPPGNHPLEVAARRGFGPLSPKGDGVWHGQSVPCVSCGGLVFRDATECDHCGQDLGDEMIERMRVHAGPWDVYEHLRPFPGVSLDRIVRQVRRGVLTATSIVRGPSTDFQWRFAGETPGLSRYFGMCWHCHKPVAVADEYCPECLSYLGFDKRSSGIEAGVASTQPGDSPEPSPTRRSRTPAQEAAIATGLFKSKPLPGDMTANVPVESASAAARRSPAAHSASTGQAEAIMAMPPNGEPGEHLAELTNALKATDLPARAVGDDTPRIGNLRTSWIAVALVLAMIVALLAVGQCRKQASQGRTLPPSELAMSQPGR